MSLQGRMSSRAQSSGAPESSDTGGGLSGAFSGNGGNRPTSRIQSLVAAGPQRMTVILVLLGMALGLVAAYVVIPTEFTGASPRHMSRQAIRQWVRMVAVGHSEDIHYDDNNALLVLQQIPNPQAVVESLAGDTQIPAAERAALEAIMDIPGYFDISGALAPQDPGVVGSTLQVLASLAAVALGVPILVIAGRTILPTRDGAKSSSRRGEQLPAASPSPAGAAAVPADQPFLAHSESPAAAAWGEDETEEGGTIHPQYGVPVLHAISTYVKGRNLDDSFAIELSPDAGSQFLGECGVSGATQVGNELQSVEFWGFDMASQETLTKVFAAPAALHDPALHAAVANRVMDAGADIVAVEPGARLALDSGAIHIQAGVKSVVCNYGGGTPNSGIETLQIEILAWHKQSIGSSMPASGYPAPAANSPFNEYAEMKFAGPGETTSPTPPPSGSMSALDAGATGTPQAPKRPEDEEEDPFGGTGNFMPYS